MPEALGVLNSKHSATTVIENNKQLLGLVY